MSSDLMDVGTVARILMDKIQSNPNQPRRDFDEAELQELADSIRESGLIQPIIVRPLREDVYELVAGERRLRAHELLGLTEISALVKERTSEVSSELSLIENLQRTDLKPSEEAHALSALATRLSFDHGLVARKIGRSVSFVTGRIELLELPTEVLEMLDAGKINLGHIRVIHEIEDPARKIEAAKIAFKQGLTAERLRGRMQRFLKEKERNSSAGRTGVVKYEDLCGATIRLFDAIGNYGFEMLRDSNKRSTLKLQLQELTRKINDAIVILDQPVAENDELPSSEAAAS